MSRYPADTPARHVQRAFQLLEELEDELRVPATSILGRRDYVMLVVGARRRLRFAAAALRAAERARGGFLGILVRGGGIVLRGFVLAALGAAFLLRVVSRSLRSVLRLVFTLRAI